MKLVKQLKLTRAEIRLPVATCLALLALLVAGSGGAYAAAPAKSIVVCVNHRSHALYLSHTCARRDKRLAWNVTGPSGANGSSGAAGARGATGAQGSAGQTGPAGPFTAVLPSGASLKGAYGAIGSSSAGLQRMGAAISFGIPLAVAPIPNFLSVGEGPTAACPGSASAPTATAGNLCIYEAQRSNILSAGFEDPITGATGSTVQPFGAEVVGLTSVAGNYDESGSWAVTAP